MKIAVYCGSRPGNEEKYQKAAREIGAYIGEHGHTLVYGAGALGTMGDVADSVLEHAGEGRETSVIGVIPQFMVERGWEKKDLPRMIVTDTMSERKAKMLELADLYIALPGGPGTLEEITEAFSLATLDQHSKKCILYSPDGYYQPLLAVYRQMIGAGFMPEAMLDKLIVAKSVEEIFTQIEAQAEESGEQTA